MIDDDSDQKVVVRLFNAGLISKEDAREALGLAPQQQPLRERVKQVRKASTVYCPICKRETRRTVTYWNPSVGSQGGVTVQHDATGGVRTIPFGSVCTLCNHVLPIESLQARVLRKRREGRD